MIRPNEKPPEDVPLTDPGEPDDELFMLSVVALSHALGVDEATAVQQTLLEDRKPEAGDLRNLAVAIRALGKAHQRVADMLGDLAERIEDRAIKAEDGSV